MSDDKKKKTPKHTDPDFRGFAVYCDPKSMDTILEPVGVTPLEIYGALKRWMTRFETEKN